MTKCDWYLIDSFQNEIGSKWKELTEEERRPFQERYDRDRERYLEQEKQRIESRRLIGIPEIRKKRGTVHRMCLS